MENFGFKNMEFKIETQFLVANFQSNMIQTNLLNIQKHIKKNNYLTIVFSSH